MQLLMGNVDLFLGAKMSFGGRYGDGARSDGLLPPSILSVTFAQRSHRFFLFCPTDRTERDAGKGQTRVEFRLVNVTYSLQGWAKVPFAGCGNGSGKLRQKW